MTADQDLIKQYEQEMVLAQQQGMVNPQFQPAMFGNQQKQNLIEYELDFKNELEDIERLLRADVLVKDKDGNEYWQPNPDKTRVFMNDVGVNDVVRNIIILVNKGKALSYYTVEEINDRVRQIKHELRVLVYNNYEQYGMDNEYKMNNYSMIIISIGSIIEDVYRRALNGETHKGLAEQRIVTQNESMMPQGMGMGMGMYPQSQKKSHWWNPFGRGK